LNDLEPGKVAVMADHVNPKLNGRVILKRANHGLNHPSTTPPDQVLKSLN